MRCLNINKQTLYVLNYLGKEKVKDSDGNYTGETTNSYTDPVEFKASVSGAKGSSQVEMFGSEINYDKTIVISKQCYGQLGITENSVLFVNKKPSYDEYEFPEYDYIVKRIAETPNVVAIAIAKARAN